MGEGYVGEFDGGEVRWMGVPLDSVGRRGTVIDFVSYKDAELIYGPTRNKKGKLTGGKNMNKGLEAVVGRVRSVV
jgi:hypothetical protein